MSGTPTDTIVYGYDEEWTDKLISYDGNGIAYDGIGNPISYLGKTLTWSKGRQLTKISDSEIDYSYSYNKDGIRTTKKNNATGVVTSYQLTDGLIAAQMTKNASGTVTEKLVFTYDSSDTVIAMRYNGTQ